MNKPENWSAIEKYPNYFVSDKGVVKSLFGGVPHILKQHKCTNGYRIVILCNADGKKTFRVHRLVATAFVKNINNEPQVDHIDGDKNNNRASNLWWCNNKSNCNNPITLQKLSQAVSGEKNAFYQKTGKKHPRSKRVLCVETQKVYGSTMDIYRELGISPGNISLACRGIIKTAKKLHWQYV